MAKEKGLRCDTMEMERRIGSFGGRDDNVEGEEENWRPSSPAFVNDKGGVLRSSVSLEGRSGVSIFVGLVQTLPIRPFDGQLVGAGGDALTRPVVGVL